MEMGKNENVGQASRLSPYFSAEDSLEFDVPYPSSLYRQAKSRRVKCWHRSDASYLNKLRYIITAMDRVAQSCTLLYRRIAFGKGVAISRRRQFSRDADYKSALHFRCVSPECCQLPARGLFSEYLLAKNKNYQTNPFSNLQFSFNHSHLCAMCPKLEGKTNPFLYLGPWTLDFARCSAYIPPYPA